MGFWGRAEEAAVSATEAIVQPAVHAAEGLGEAGVGVFHGAMEGVEHAGEAAGKWVGEASTPLMDVLGTGEAGVAGAKAAQGAEAAGGKVIPYLGALIGGGQMIYHGYEAFNATNQDSKYDHLGSAVLGMLGGIPADGAYTGGAELAWNAGAVAGTAAARGHLGGSGAQAEENGAVANQMLGRGMRGVASLFGDGPAYNPLTPRTEGGEGGGHEAPAAPAAAPSVPTPAPAAGATPMQPPAPTAG